MPQGLKLTDGSRAGSAVEQRHWIIRYTYTPRGRSLSLQRCVQEDLGTYLPFASNPRVETRRCTELHEC